MTDKSYVTMQMAQCPVCGKQHDTGTILMHKQMREVFERKTLTHLELCPEHKKVVDDGFLILVECDPSKSTITGDKTKPQNAYRTGNLGYLKKETAKRIFNIPTGDLPFVYVEPGVLEMLKEMQEKSND